LARAPQARDGLGKTDSAMANVTAELVLPNVPTDRRAWLATELVRLMQERGGAVPRIDQLTARTQELQESVREMERRSPYPI
jgi:hypothetical protein